MSLEGNVTGQTLVGSINKCDTLTISAYGIAVKNGFKGTEEEWLDSLNGGLITVDKQLYRSGHAADAAVTGEKINSLSKKIDSEIDSLSKEVDSEIGALSNEIAVERTRINNISKLEAGSTTGDAELIDIRVDYEGNTHTTAGDAVRAQAQGIANEVSHLANLVSLDENIFPHNKNGWTHGNYNYPTFTNRFRSDFIKVDPRKTKIKFKPNIDDIRVCLELYSDGGSGEYVHVKDTSSPYYDYTFNTEGASAIRIVISRKDNATVTLEDFYHASENVQLLLETEKCPSKVRVMQYNVGEFNMGRDISNPIIDQSKIGEYITKYKKFFGEQMADILCLEECYEYMDTAQNYPVNETLLDGIYPYVTERSYGCQLASRHYVIENKHLHFSNGNEVGNLLHTMVCEIHGKEVFVCSGHFRVLATEESRKSAFDQLITEANKYDYAIFGVDTNAQSSDEHRYYTETAEANGYSVANGGYFGNIPTIPGSSAYQNIDNVFVKGGIIANAYAPDVLATLASDHLPFVADILLY